MCHEALKSPGPLMLPPVWWNRVHSKSVFEAPDISGASDVIEWFGGWPTFHDSEVLSIHLDRTSESRVAIHAFQMTSEVDGEGFYVLTKHAIVTFFLKGFPRNQYGITSSRIECFNEQNMLSSVSVSKGNGYYELKLSGCFGVDACIVCAEMSVKIEPGIPPDSMRLNR